MWVFNIIANVGLDRMHVTHTRNMEESPNAGMALGSLVQIMFILSKLGRLGYY